MEKHCSSSHFLEKIFCLSSILFVVGSFSYSGASLADVQGIPYNRDFPQAQHPYAQAPDACSGVTDRPDSNGEIRDTWGPVDFRGACNTHDKCYYTYGSNWNTCNERFYSDLRAACERDLRVSTPVGKLPPDPVRLAECYKLATTYYTGVQAGVGIGVFRKAQDKQRRYEGWVASLRRVTICNRIPSTATFFLNSELKSMEGGKCGGYTLPAGSKFKTSYSKNGKRIEVLVNLEGGTYDLVKLSSGDIELRRK